MGTLHQIQRWSLSHNPRWLVVPRVALGIMLFAKGISFMSHATDLVMLLERGFALRGSAWLALAITWAHLLGGFLIIIGLFTRLAAIIQIPILIGAVFFLNVLPDVPRGVFEFPFALFSLLLLFVFLIEGGGRFSLDYYFKHYQA